MKGTRNQPQEISNDCNKDDHNKNNYNESDTFNESESQSIDDTKLFESFGPSNKSPSSNNKPSQKQNSQDLQNNRSSLKKDSNSKESEQFVIEYDDINYTHTDEMSCSQTDNDCLNKVQYDAHIKDHKRMLKNQSCQRHEVSCSQTDDDCKNTVQYDAHVKDHKRMLKNKSCQRHNITCHDHHENSLKKEFSDYIHDKSTKSRSITKSKSTDSKRNNFKISLDKDGKFKKSSSKKHECQSSKNSHCHSSKNSHCCKSPKCSDLRHHYNSRTHCGKPHSNNPNNEQDLKQLLYENSNCYETQKKPLRKSSCGRAHSYSLTQQRPTDNYNDESTHDDSNKRRLGSAQTDFPETYNHHIQKQEFTHDNSNKRRLNSAQTDFPVTYNHHVQRQGTGYFEDTHNIPQRKSSRPKSEYHNCENRVNFIEKDHTDDATNIFNNPKPPSKAFFPQPIISSPNPTNSIPSNYFVNTNSITNSTTNPYAMSSNSNRCPPYAFNDTYSMPRNHQQYPNGNYIKEPKSA